MNFNGKLDYTASNFNDYVKDKPRIKSLLQ